MSGEIRLSGAEALALSAKAAEKLIVSRSGNAALLYIYMLKTHASGSLREAAQALGFSAQEAAKAMDELCAMGLAARDEEISAPPPQDDTPHYTAEDIRREFDEGGAFPSLVAEVEKYTGHVSSSDDLARLFGIYDSLGLPPEVIVQIAAWCAGERERKYGPGRRPTVKYIEKTAYAWERDGIYDLDDALAHIDRLAKSREALAEAKRALGIRGRDLSATEEKYVRSWLSMGFGCDAIAEAYDRTVTKTGQLAWKYMDTIIRSWNAKGLKTAEAIEKGDRRGGSSSRAAARTAPAAKTAVPSADELERMKRMLDDYGEGGGSNGA